MARTRGDVF